MPELYAAQPGSPSALLVAGISVDALSFVIDDIGILPAGPNIATIGSGYGAEVVLYASISEGGGQTTVTVTTRGYSGTTAKQWAAGASVARLYTSYDHDSLRLEIAKRTRTATKVVAGANATDNVKEQADYVCDGTDDNVQIKEAIDALTPGRTWAETVMLIGDFNVSVAVSIPSHTCMDMHQASITISEDVSLFTAYGSISAKESNLTADATEWTWPIPVVSDADFSIDDYVMISSKKEYAWSGAGVYPDAEIHRIMGIGYQLDYPPTPNTIYIGTRPWIPYEMSDSAKMSVVDMVVDVHIRGANVMCMPTGTLPVIDMLYAANMSIRGMNITVAGQAGAIKLAGCVEGDISGNIISGDLNEADQYGIQVTGASCNLNIHDNNVSGMEYIIRGGIEDGEPGSPMYITWNNNILHKNLPGQNVITITPCMSVGMAFVGNHISGACGSGFYVDALKWAAYDNDINVSEEAFNLNGFITETVFLHNNVVSVCRTAIKITSCQAITEISIVGLYVNSYANECVSIIDCILAAVYVSGVYAVNGNTETCHAINIVNVPDACVISSVIAKSMQAGIYLYQCYDGTIANVTTYNNNQGVSADVLIGSGIVLSKSENITVHANRVYDDQTGAETQLYGISEEDTCAGNMMSNNLIYGNINDSIISGTTDAVIVNNKGYVTTSAGLQAIVTADGEKVVVSHGLSKTPGSVMVTAYDWGSASKVWVSDIGATEFTINIDVDPVSASFYWKATI